MQIPALAALEALAQANTLAFNDFRWLSALLFALLIPLIWIAKPPFSHVSGAIH